MALFNPVVTSPYQNSMNGYPSYTVPQTQMSQQTTGNQSNSIIWVQGNGAAKSYPVAPGNTIMMLDSEEPVFYIKSVDTSGMPMPLRTFDFTERTENTVQKIDTDNFITRDEFEKRIAEIGKEKVNETKKRQSAG